MNARLFLVIIVLLGNPALGQDKEENRLAAKGAKPVLVSSGFKFTEGPASDGRGNIFFTDQPNNWILKWSPQEGVSVYMENAGRSNGR
jgi:gluconolactonase